MPTTDAIRWFKREFGQPITAAVAGTPFTPDLLTAIACQETGFIWNTLRKKGLSTKEILALCVGDVIDGKPTGTRTAFPKNKKELVDYDKDGARMFEIARQSLVDMAKHFHAYRPSAQNAVKFCRGFGIFQYDLQFFKTDPAYFLDRRYERFDESLAKAIGELHSKLKRLGWQDKTQLTELESVGLAIAYNSGRYDPKKGLKQGHCSNGKYYGEAVLEYLRLASTVSANGSGGAATAIAGIAPLPAPTPVAAAGALHVVDVRETSLNVRSEPVISKPKNGNVIATLPDGQLVRAVGDKKKNGFLEIETSLGGALVRGFVSATYLKPAPAGADVPVVAPAAAPPTTGVTAVFMPHKPGQVTRRTEPAGAHSLNESKQPGRKGTDAATRRAELAAIIDWLAVDKPAHARYRPRDGLTFCNIYAHDYCHLAGCYLPRVWWTGTAIEALAQGKKVEPLLGKTIEEVRANALFSWLRDFGPRFGWQRAASLTELQLEVNQGAVGLISARRKTNAPGHVVAVVPETEAARAKRDASGAVVAALQSQAGSTNFRYGTGKVDWFKDERFADFAFWLHA